MSSENPSVFMRWTVENIRNYMKENNIDNNLNINKPIPSLGINRIEVTNEYHWIIYMNGPKNSIYANGYFQLTIDFAKEFPKTTPEIRFINKIYHLQVSPINGHVVAGFLNNWNPTTTKSECLVGIYLFLLLPQNPDSPYKIEMAREYKNNRPEFDRKAREWTLKYAAPTIDDLKMLYEKRFLELENRNKILEQDITYIKNELNQMKSIISKKDSEIDSYKEKYIKLLEEIKDLKLKNQ